MDFQGLITPRGQPVLYPSRITAVAKRGERPARTSTWMTAFLLSRKGLLRAQSLKLPLRLRQSAQGLETDQHARCIIGRE
jgi:hypothetical protein